MLPLASVYTDVLYICGSKLPNYNFCISQGSVATVSKCNYSHLRQVLS